jgi:hypothetical protein
MRFNKLSEADKADVVGYAVACLVCAVLLVFGLWMARALAVPIDPPYVPACEFRPCR